jgi:hypothetical protein
MTLHRDLAYSADASFHVRARTIHLPLFWLHDDSRSRHQLNYTGGVSPQLQFRLEFAPPHRDHAVPSLQLAPIDDGLSLAAIVQRLHQQSDLLPSSAFVVLSAGHASDDTATQLRKVQRKWRLMTRQLLVRMVSGVGNTGSHRSHELRHCASS